MINKDSKTVLGRAKIKGKTTGGDYCHQIISLIEDKGYGCTSLFVTKFVLTDNFSPYDKAGFINLKEYKGKRLYRQVFAVRLSTLSEILKWISDILGDKYKK